MSSFSIYFLISTLLIIINGLFLLVLFRKGTGDHLKSLKIYFILATTWIILELLVFFSSNNQWVLFWNLLLYPVKFFSITVLIIFILKFVGKQISRPGLIFLLGFSGLFSLLHLINQWPHLSHLNFFYLDLTDIVILDRTFGVGFLSMICLFILMVLYALMQTFQYRTLSPKVFIVQMKILIYSTLSFLMLALAQSIGLIPVVFLQSPIAIMIPGYVFMILSMRYNTLNMIPFSRSKVIEDINDALLTISRQGIVLDMNQHMISIVNQPWRKMIGLPLTEAFPQLQEKLSEIRENNQTNAKSTILPNHRRFLFKHNMNHYDTCCYEQPDTYLIVLHDISSLIQTFQATNQLAKHDSLTGINNRRHIESSIKKWLTWDPPQEIPYCFVIFDIDHLKQFNDQFGHQQGDQVIKEISRIFETTIRTTDLFGRFGGDEFIVLLTDITEEQAKHILERTRKMIQEHPFATDTGTQFFSTISMGAICTSSYDTVSYDDLFRMADEALYKAKEKGRNRICMRRRLSIPETPDSNETNKSNLFQVP